jgi:hypothetical protein
VLASKVRVEISVRNTPLIPAVLFRPALYLPLRPSLLMATLFPFLRLFLVCPLLRLLHLPVVLACLRMPISTLRFLVAAVIIAMIFGPSLLLRPSLLLPILRLRSLLPLILVLILLVLILRDGHPRRSHQQRSANPTHD